MCRPVYSCLSEGPLGFCCKAQASMCLLPFLILTGVNVFFMVMEAAIGGHKYYCNFVQEDGSEGDICQVAGVAWLLCLVAEGVAVAVGCRVHKLHQAHAAAAPRVEAHAPRPGGINMTSMGGPQQAPRQQGFVPFSGGGTRLGGR